MWGELRDGGVVLKEEGTGGLRSTEGTGGLGSTDGLLDGGRSPVAGTSPRVPRLPVPLPTCSLVREPTGPHHVPDARSFQTPLPLAPRVVPGTKAPVSSFSTGCDPPGLIPDLLLSLPSPPPDPTSLTFQGSVP